MKVLSNNNLKKLGLEVPKKGIFIVVLCSKWCKSCHLLSKTLEHFKDEDIIMLKELDISENGALARKLNISVIPALILFNDGKLLNKNIQLYGETIVKNGILIGSFNKEILNELIKEI